MAEQKTASPLLGKMGAALVTAHMASKDKPADPGNVQLPGGIENGIAEVRTLKFGTYEKGDYKGKDYFMGSAVVQMPVNHAVTDPTTKETRIVKTQGGQTRIGPMPLCETTRKVNGVPTPVSFQENYEAFLNELKLLGLDASKIVPPATMSPDQKGAFIFNSITDGMKKLVEGVKQKDGSVKKTYTRFRTWRGSKQVVVPRGDKFAVEDEDGKNFKGLFATREIALKAFPYAEKEPMVNHYWQGAVEFSPNGVVAAATQDDSEHGAEVEKPTSAPSSESEADTPADEAAFDEFADDLDTLAQRASDPDDEVAKVAVDSLVKKAQEAGIEEVDDDEHPGEKKWPGDTWEDLVVLIKAATEGDGAATEAPTEEPFVPELGAIYGYQQVDKDGKPVKDTRTKRAKKPIDVVIKKVDAAKGTCDVVDNLTKRIAIKGVKFDDLLDAAE